MFRSFVFIFLFFFSDISVVFFVSFYKFNKVVEVFVVSVVNKFRRVGWLEFECREVLDLEGGRRGNIIFGSVYLGIVKELVRVYVERMEGLYDDVVVICVFFIKSVLDGS